MTMPDERTRAVWYVRDFLVALATPSASGGFKGIPQGVRDQAHRLLKHYPTPIDLRGSASFDEKVIDQYSQEQEARWQAM
jgi:hypothetical protein